jgi:hypothetical protein
MSEEKLVPIALKAINAGNIDLKKLIDFRKREAKEGGHTIRDLRHRYADRLESYVKKLTMVKGTQSDRREIERQFDADMRDDLASLRDELNFAANDVLFSKDMIAAVIAGIGTLAALAFAHPLAMQGVMTIAGAPVTIGGLLGLKNKYLSSRRSILQQHPMAYLYQLEA